MSFINWGEESAEQKALRAFFEQQALYEQAARIKMQSQGGVGAAAGSGGPNIPPAALLYGIAFNGLVYRLDSTEENWEYNYETFPEFACATLNPDDGFLYAVIDFVGDVYFIRIDRDTRNFEFIDNNISDFSSKGASSLYYEDNGQFIYLDNAYKGSVTSIIRVTLDSPATATATEVSEIDSEETGFLLRNLFPYEGQVWAIGISGPLIQMGPFDIDAGDFIYSNEVLPSPSQPEVVEISGVFSTITHKGIVYMVAVWIDEFGNFNPGLFTVDTEYGGALAPYYVTLIREAVIESAGEVPVYSLISF